MATALVGTSGYSYEDWVGPVYPEGTRQGDFLALYTAWFPIVELNFSYYQQPQPKTLKRMVSVTPEGFLFSLKAHRSLTHEVSENLSADIDTFKKGIAPLVDASRLCAVLLQFPYSFHYTPESRKHLDRLCAAFAGYPIAVEFRNNEWQREQVYEGLRQREAALVSVDEPDLPKLLKPTETVTSYFSYIRFHGRNKANWWAGDNASRYDYLYSDEELASWISRIQAVMQHARLLLIFFNNHRRGQAVQNARSMGELLLKNSLS